MVEMILLGVFLLFLSWAIGYLIRRGAREELETGQPYFRAIILFSFLGAVGALFLQNDVFFFFFLGVMAFVAPSIRTRVNPQRKHSHR